MNTKDYEVFRDAVLNLERLLGKIEEQHSQPPADPPAFLTTGMRFAAQEGAFRLYVKDQGGDAERAIQRESDCNVQSETEVRMKYLTKRADGRWQGSKTIDGKRVFVYARTQME